LIEQSREAVSLSAGIRLGAYEIVATLGEDGINRQELLSHIVLIDNL